ncbi:MAG: DUF4431 domain-containing protein [Proteobacteria bacterium]|nr:DUF4431 domain-containing protein [Pseudomonadota bacterium]
MTMRSVQLAFDQPEDFSRYRLWLNRRVVVRGRWFAATSGHHHTPMLIANPTISGSD